MLIVQEWYRPGVRGGGPVQSVANVVDRLGDRLDISILCRDRDLGDHAPYTDVPIDRWTQWNGCRTYYCPPERQTVVDFATIAEEARPDLIYVQGVFAKLAILCLLARRWGALRDVPTVICPRGDLLSERLASKPSKKAAFLHLFGCISALDRILWQPTSDREASDLIDPLGPVAHRIVSNLPAKLDQARVTPPTKRAGEVRIAFLSRVAPNKGLHRLLEAMRSVDASVHLTAYGPKEDAGYWRRCEALASQLPSQHSFRYGGVVEREDLATTLAEHHVFALPTEGENFGHAIAEAAAVGLPLLVGQGTPWTDLAKRGAGWDIHHADLSGWTEALERCAAMDESTWRRMSQESRKTFDDVTEVHRTERETVELLSWDGRL